MTSSVVAKLYSGNTTMRMKIDIPALNFPADTKGQPFPLVLSLRTGRTCSTRWPGSVLTTLRRPPPCRLRRRRRRCLLVMTSRCWSHPPAPGSKGDIGSLGDITGGRELAVPFFIRTTSTGLASCSGSHAVIGPLGPLHSLSSLTWWGVIGERLRR